MVSNTLRTGCQRGRAACDQVRKSSRPVLGTHIEVTGYLVAPFMYLCIILIY